MLKLSEKQLTDILNYLSTRPWVEVNNLIVELTKLEKIEVDKDLKDDTKDLKTH